MESLKVDLTEVERRKNWPPPDEKGRELREAERRAVDPSRWGGWRRESLVDMC